jgi:hypothetical protein
MLIIGSQTFGQILFGTKEESNTKIIINESLIDLSVNQRFDFLELETITTEAGSFHKLNMGNDFVSSNKIGQADLPIYTYLIEIPFCEDIMIEEKSIEDELLIDNKNKYAQELRKQFKNNHEELKKNKLIKGVSPGEIKNNFRVPTPLKFLSVVVTIYMIITAILYILTYMGIPIMAI